jgi:hypothetical protein
MGPRHTREWPVQWTRATGSQPEWLCAVPGLPTSLAARQRLRRPTTIDWAVSTSGGWLSSLAMER